MGRWRLPDPIGRQREYQRKYELKNKTYLKAKRRQRYLASKEVVATLQECLEHVKQLS